MSSCNLTLSLTKKPPVSSATFQIRPKSLRLSSPVPSKPARALPKGSVAVPVGSTVMSMLFVTPLIVRFPVTTKVSPAALIAVDSKTNSFVLSVSKKSALFK